MEVQLVLEIRRCGMIANETTMFQTSNEVDVNNYMAFHNEKNAHK